MSEIKIKPPEEFRTMSTSRRLGYLGVLGVAYQEIYELAREESSVRSDNPQIMDRVRHMHQSIEELLKVARFDPDPTVERLADKLYALVDLHSREISEGYRKFTRKCPNNYPTDWPHPATGTFQ